MTAEATDSRPTNAAARRRATEPHVTSPTSERAQAGPEPDPELAALGDLYARQSPDMPPVPGGHVAYLREAARSHLRLAEQRSPGEPTVRVRALETADASGAGGVVEILTDDMPSLVESVLAGIVRAGAEVRR